MGELEGLRKRSQLDCQFLSKQPRPLTEDNQENEGFLRQETARDFRSKRNFVTFVSFCLIRLKRAGYGFGGFSFVTPWHGPA
jgi:hypothetical protein